MEAISKIYPNASIKGIEPSEQESDNARENGFPVITTKLNTQKGHTRGIRFGLFY